MEEAAVLEEAAAPPAVAPEVIMVEVGCIFPSPRNRHCAEDDPKIFDMAESIDEVGLINPITVRPVADGHEIVSGERRWLAHRLLGRKMMPCIVQKLSDDQAQALRITENLHRQDLSPLEEGDSIVQLLEILEREMPGKNIHKEAARRLGYEEGWVRHRAKLPCLVQAWRDEIANPESRYHRFQRSVGHMEQIAMLPESSQEQLLVDNVLAGCKTVEDVRAAIARWVMNLDFKPWSREFEKKRVSSAKRCDACYKRSDKERTLFSELHDATDVTDKAKVRLCLDPECWRERVAAWCGFLLETNPDAVALWDGNPNPAQEKAVQDSFGLRVLSYYQWSETSGDAYTRQVQGVFLGGARVGTMLDVWLRDAVQDEEYDQKVVQRREAAQQVIDTEQAKADALREMVEGLIPEDVFAFQEHATLGDFTLALRLFNWAVWFGVGVFGRDGADMMVLDDTRAGSPGIRSAWAQVREEVVTRVCEILDGETLSGNDAVIVNHLCECLSIDLDALKEEAGQ